MTMWKQLDQALREVAANGGTVPALEALQNPAAWMDRLKAARPADAAGQDFERSLLARAAIASIPQIAALNLPEGVQQSYIRPGYRFQSLTLLSHSNIPGLCIGRQSPRFADFRRDNSIMLLMDFRDPGSHEHHCKTGRV